MKQSYSSSAEKKGLPPGTLVHVGKAEKAKSHISVFVYNSKDVKKFTFKSVEELLEYKDKDCVVWVKVEGLGNISFIQDIGKYFDVHSLVLEDILNTRQRVKFDDYQKHLFFVLKALSFDSEKVDIPKGIHTSKRSMADLKQKEKVDSRKMNHSQHLPDEQISLLVVHNFVFVFMERPSNLFDDVEKRLDNADSRLRKNGSDYLAYALIDNIVDNYFILLDEMDEITESIDEKLLTNPSAKTLHTIQSAKRTLISTKRSISPLRECLLAILRSDSPLIKDKTQIYFRDVYDHSIRVIESLDSYREMVSGLLDIYLSSVSNKMNSVMKVLTIFAAIFIPLTFIAGVYGMNFEYMPELKMKWAYPSVWILFIVVTGLLLIFFKRKKWL